MGSDDSRKEAKRVRFLTLGCKVNQYETQGMREVLARERIVEGPSGPGACDFVVVNTCTVTGEADRNNRYWIRRLRREHPRAKIIVTGCYAERDAADLAKLAAIDLIVPNSEKSRIAEKILALENGKTENLPEWPEAQTLACYESLPVSGFLGHSRAFLKIQDGCNHACSFCKVVLVRGRSRSRPLDEVVEEALRLRDAGYREIVLTGVQVGAYGLDLKKRSGLPDALEALARIRGIGRIRISAIEPADVTDEVIRALREVPKCCPHLHIPLQSGDDGILKAMNRRYCADFYLERIERLRAEVPDFTLTLDVMCGFPGEDEACFSNTCRVLERARPLKCHVFPFSRRSGTRAARLPGQVPSAVIKDRVRRVFTLEAMLGRSEAGKYGNRVFDVLVESGTAKNGFAEGLTANYLRVAFPANGAEPGSSVTVRLKELRGRKWQGEICGVPGPLHPGSGPV